MRKVFAILLMGFIFSATALADDTADLFAALEEMDPEKAKKALPGANVKATNANGESVLHVCARQGEGGFIEDLMNAGAELEARNRRGQTPLLVAVEFDNEAEVRLLVANGADLTAVDSEGRSAMAIAAELDDLSLFDYLANHAQEDWQPPLPALEPDPAQVGRAVIPGRLIPVAIFMMAGMGMFLGSGKQ